MKKNTMIVLVAFGAFAVLGVFFLLFVRGALREHHRIDGETTFRHLGMHLKMYAFESVDNVFPPLRSTPGHLLFSADEEVAKEATEESSTYFSCDDDVGLFELAEISMNPASQEHAFYYLGYFVTNEEEMAAFAEAYQENLREGGDFTKDLPVANGTGSGGGDTLLRLTKHVGESRSSIPILIEKLGHYHVPGAYVLYTDGYSEFIDYPGKWPMTKTTMDLLKALEEASTTTALPHHGAS